MKKILLIVAVLFLGAPAAWAEEVSFTLSAPRVVSMNETFRVTFSVNAGADNFTGPDFAGFNILAGPSKSTNQSFQLVNGKASHSQSTNFVYVLQATKEGKETIGAATLVIDGKTYRTQPAVLEVLKADDAAQAAQVQQNQNTTAAIGNDELFVRLTLSKSNVYRGEYLTATVKLYTQAGIAGFEDVKFPTFNGFWSQEIEAPQQLDFQRESVNGKVYNVAVIRRYVLFPQQTGELKIEPFEVTCVMQVRSSSRSLFDDFFSSPQLVRKRIVSPVSTINVKDLPGNAPVSFAGAVGTNFKMTAELTHDSITANDAMSLLIKVSGEGNVKLAEAPKVTLPPDFETYDMRITDNSKTSSSGVSGTKQFELPFIPRSAGAFTISPVAFTYFDIAKKQYITITSKPLPLKVSKDLNAGSATTVTGLNRQTVKSLGEDIRYIKTEVPKWHKKGIVFFGSFAYYTLLLLELLLFIGLYIVLNKHRKTVQNIVLVRNKKANKVARKRLKTAGQLLKSGDESGFYKELTKALWGYLSDKLTIAVADLSRENTREILINRQLPETDMESFLQVIDECEFARYAPAGGRMQMQKIYDEAMALISRFEQLLK